MATLTVWKFDTPEGAQQAEQALFKLQRQELITVLDAATVSWPEGKKRPRTRQANDLWGPGLLGGMFWGLLFGIIFFIPLIGLAVGAATGALIGALTDIGIDDKFIKDVREKVTPGTSALFVLSQDAVVDRVHSSLRDEGIHGELIETNLSAEEEARLRAAVNDDHQDA